MVSPVIDLSHHNPTPDFGRMKAAGVVGVIHKATEGLTYQDPDRRARLASAVKAGLSIATYHFLRPGDMAGQMAHYVRTIQPRPGERLIIDHEDSGVSVADLREAVKALLGQGFEVTIYSGHLIKDQLGNSRDDVLAKTSLWIAQYTSASSPTWPKGTWATWSLWQWTDKETVPGIAAPVDGNRWNGTSDNLRRWFGV